MNEISDFYVHLATSYLKIKAVLQNVEGTFYRLKSLRTSFVIFEINTRILKNY